MYQEKGRVLIKANLLKIVINNLFDEDQLTVHNKLYQEAQIAKKRRQNELIKNKKATENCTFQPEKKSGLEFQYSDEFRQPHLRLYNNYFEIQEKLL